MKPYPKSGWSKISIFEGEYNKRRFIWIGLKLGMVLKDAFGKMR